jgi:Asp-tRNA(Asn)/Glu-tRNA(Gln) amidotransferase A subunit family amidase
MVVNSTNSCKSFNVSVFTEDLSALTVGVLSRLHFTLTKEKPLAGLRIAVKDTQNVRGAKTTGSSRAQAGLYGSQEKSATEIQCLLDHGAIVVGKLKSTQFGESEWATRDLVDFHAPWNHGEMAIKLPVRVALVASPLSSHS